jgi:DNA-binding transcriptional ArsR family regulator
LRPPPPQHPRTPRHKARELFLKGPIPWRWVQAAARLPGHALAVGLALWHLIGLRKCHMVRLSPSKPRSLGLSPRVARRGLKALERAGLLAVDRHRGRSPDVTVLDVAEQEALDMVG